MASIVREILITLVIALFVFLMVQLSFQSIEVNGSSMEPTIYDGQRIIVLKAAYWFGEPKRGDVVIFRNPDSPRDVIHRVVGLPDELVEIDKGELYIDGVKYQEGYIQGSSVSVPSHVVPADSYFIVGDNRDGAGWDMVSRGNIVGRAWLCYWPLADWHLVRGYSYPEDQM